MQAPTTEQPTVFAFDKGKVLKNAIPSILLWTVLFLWNVYDIVTKLPKGRSIAFDVVLGLFAAFWLLVTILSACMSYGAKIEIQGGIIRRVGANGKVFVKGPLNKVEMLKANQNISQNKPASYSVVWTPKIQLIFDNRVEGVETLIMMLEQQTGKQFVLQRS